PLVTDGEAERIGQPEGLSIAVLRSVLRVIHRYAQPLPGQREARCIQLDVVLRADHAEAIGDKRVEYALRDRLALGPGRRIAYMDPHTAQAERDAQIGVPRTV